MFLHYIYMPTSSDKWRYTLYTTLVLLLLFYPWKTTSYKCLGFLLRAFLFTIIVRYMMDLHL